MFDIFRKRSRKCCTLTIMRTVFLTKSFIGHCQVLSFFLIVHFSADIWPDSSFHWFNCISNFWWWGDCVCLITFHSQYNTFCSADTIGLLSRKNRLLLSARLHYLYSIYSLCGPILYIFFNNTSYVEYAARYWVQDCCWIRNESQSSYPSFYSMSH